MRSRTAGSVSLNRLSHITAQCYARGRERATARRTRTEGARPAPVPVNENGTGRSTGPVPLRPGVRRGSGARYWTSKVMSSATHTGTFWSRL